MREVGRSSTTRSRDKTRKVAGDLGHKILRSKIDLEVVSSRAARVLRRECATTSTTPGTNPKFLFLKRAETSFFAPRQKLRDQTAPRDRGGGGGPGSRTGRTETDLTEKEEATRGYGQR